MSANNKPSAEAVEDARLVLHDYLPEGCSTRFAREALAAAYSIDTPAIHAAGVLEGRAAMRDEIVLWLVQERGYERAANAIEAAFPTTGEKTDG